jgi:hypothetical protein
MKPAPPDLRLSEQASGNLHAAARGSRRREHGGILVGYRESGGLVVEDALTVTDESATHGGYLRRAKTAQAVLAKYLSHQVDPMIGYVGEWHTHPLPVPPSAADHASMAIMAIRNTEQIGLLVAALDHNFRTVSYYALATEPGRTSRRRTLYRKARVVLC